MTKLKARRRRNEHAEWEEIELEWWLRKNRVPPREIYLFLKGGSTGYESAPITQLRQDMDKYPDGSWLACFGTGGYQELSVPYSSILEIKAEIEAGIEMLTDNQDPEAIVRSWI